MTDKGSRRLIVACCCCSFFVLIVDIYEMYRNSFVLFDCVLVSALSRTQKQQQLVVLIIVKTITALCVNQNAMSLYCVCVCVCVKFINEREFGIICGNIACTAYICTDVCARASGIITSKTLNLLFFF